MKIKQEVNKCEECQFRKEFYCTKDGHSISDAVVNSKISQNCPFNKKKRKVKAIDRVTTDRLQMVLRMAGIELPFSLIDNVIDLVELIEDKGGNVSLKDIENLKSEWQ